MRDRRHRSHLGRPLANRAAANLRLRQVVNHELLSRQAARKFQRRFELPRINQDVVGEAKFSKHPHAAQKLLAQQKARVRLRLNDVTESTELSEPRKMLEPV